MKNLRTRWPLGALVLVVAAIAACGIDSDRSGREPPAETKRTLTVVCWQDSNDRFLDLDDAGKGKTEARIELFKDGTAKAWFDSFLLPDFDVTSTGMIARALLAQGTRDVTIYVCDANNRAITLLLILARASSVCEEAGVVLRVEHRRGGYACPSYY